jgi:hypothetical protein
MLPARGARKSFTKLSMPSTVASSSGGLYEAASADTSDAVLAYSIEHMLACIM